MQGIKDRVAIVGMGCTSFGERWDADAADLMVEAAYEAYEDAGLDSKDIQAGWVGTAQSFRTGQALAQALKLDYIPITRVENACATATDAFRNASYAVAAGIYDIVIAMGVEKLKDSGFSGLAIAEGSDQRRGASDPASVPVRHGGHPLLPSLWYSLRGREADPGPDCLEEPPQRHAEPQGPLPA